MNLDFVSTLQDQRQNQQQTWKVIQMWAVCAEHSLPFSAKRPRALESQDASVVLQVLKCELQKGLKSGMITTIGKKIVQNNETIAVYENVQFMVLNIPC